MKKAFYLCRQRLLSVSGYSGPPYSVKGIAMKVCQWELLPTNLSAPGGVYGPRRTTVLNPPPNVTTSTSSPSWSFLDAIGISRPTFFFNFSAEGHSSLGHCFFHHMSFPTN